MTKQELVAKLAEKAEMTKKDAGIVIDSMVEVMKESLIQGEEVALPGFGKFVVAERAARTGHNPQTGESLEIPACKAVKFKVGSALKASVNE